MESIKQFGWLVRDVWTHGLWGIDIGRYVLALLLLTTFLLLRRLFTRMVIRRLEALFRRTRWEVGSEAIRALEKPIRFVPVVVGVFLALDFLSLSGELSKMADQVVRSLIAYVIFWGFVNLVHPLSFLLKGLEKIFAGPMVEWLIKTIRAGLFFLGAATILEIWGIKVGPIIAGLGLFGVAVALGAQDLFKNLISGLLIIAERRFDRGDWIRVDGVVEGTVENIGFRSTLVRRFDKAPVFVPNAKLSDQAVINFSAMTHRRIYWQIGVEYRTSVAQLRRIRDDIEGYILESDAFAKPPEVSTFVRIDRFSDSSIDIMIYCFTRTTQWGEWLAIKEALAYKIKEIVAAAGSSFAFPSQSLYIENPPGESPEVFVPPE